MTTFTEKEEQKFTLLYEQANHAGELSANAIELPMRGMCGFAVVHFPASTKFSKWMLKEGYARRDSYQGGMRMNIASFGQSFDKKSAYAYGFAGILDEMGIKKVWVDTRLD